ncbi:hypothetical protein Tco_0864115 [Tanacetum coccineum]
MSSSTHPIIIPSDYDVEDAFSSTHSPDYISASPDYFPASPGNTSPDPLDDLSKYLLTSLAISPFHDDPYMKVMQAYDATNNESPILLPRAPIAPPTVLPPSPMFNPRDFFLPEEILPSHKLPLERIENMEDKIEGLGHDDEVVLARVKTSTLEILIEDIQICHQLDMKSLLDKIHKLKNHKGGPPDY